MKKWIIVLIVVVVVAVGGFILVKARAQNAAAADGSTQTQPLAKGDLTAIVGATGTVRANQTANLSWQTSGTVKDVSVKEGDPVAAQQVLASLEQTSLPQSVILAQADLVSAQKALDDLRNSQLQQAKAGQALEQAQQALQDAQDPEQNRSKAGEALAKAQKAVQDAQSALLSKQSPASQSQIDQAEAQVTFAKDKLDKAKDAYQPYANKPDSNLTRARLLSAMAAAQQQYDAAVRTLNSLTGVAGPIDQAVAQANLDAAKAQLAQAQRDWERLKDGPTPADIALLEAQVADAQREWDRLKNGPDPNDLAAAEARVAAAQATINSARLTAPFDGVVTLVDTQVGDQVSPGTPAFRLDDLSSLLVDVPVSEVDISRVKPGQDATLNFDAIANQDYHGKVKDVAQVGTSAQGAVNFTVTVEMTDADQAVRPGMTAAVNIVVDQLKDVLLVPNRAVRVLDSNRVVYVLKNGQSQPVKITLGASSDTMSELLSGDLQVGDLIVLNPPVTFGPGGGGGGPFGGQNNQSSGGNQP
jgi:HlyD family secretion protein